MSRVTITFGEVRLKSKYVLFVCFRIIVPLENFSLIWRRHHYRWRTASFDLFSVLMTIEQWGFFRMPHLLWHGASVYNGHLTPFAERLAVELSIPNFTTYVYCGLDSNTQPFACGANALFHCTIPDTNVKPCTGNGDVSRISTFYLLKMFYRVTYMHE